MSFADFEIIFYIFFLFSPYKTVYSGRVGEREASDKGGEGLFIKLYSEFLSN